jgi:ATP-dependent DNA ligase
MKARYCPCQGAKVFAEGPQGIWVEPSFTAEVEYRDITSEYLLRQSSFKGLERGS